MAPTEVRLPFFCELPPRANELDVGRVIEFQSVAAERSAPPRLLVIIPELPRPPSDCPFSGRSMSGVYGLHASTNVVTTTSAGKDNPADRCTNAPPNEWLTLHTYHKGWTSRHRMLVHRSVIDAQSAPEHGEVVKGGPSLHATSITRGYAQLRP